MINMDFLMLIIWVVAGLLTFIVAEINEEHKVSIISYFLVWMVLILELINNVVPK